MVKRVNLQCKDCEFELGFMTQFELGFTSHDSDQKSTTREATGNHVIRIHFTERTQCRISVFCIAQNQVCCAAVKEGYKHLQKYLQTADQFLHAVFTVIALPFGSKAKEAGAHPAPYTN